MTSPRADAIRRAAIPALLRFAEAAEDLLDAQPHNTGQGACCRQTRTLGQPHAPQSAPPARQEVS